MERCRNCKRPTILRRERILFGKIVTIEAVCCSREQSRQVKARFGRTSAERRAAVEAYARKVLS